MRYAMWWGGFVTSLMIGCGQQAAQKSTIDHSKSADTAHVESSEAKPAEIADNVPPADKPSDTTSDPVELDAITLKAPRGWTRKPAGSQFVLAEFVVPRAEGDDADGRLTISTAGGSVEANIDRWKGQFQPQPTAAKQDVVDVAGLKVTIVDLAGDFNDQRGPFAPAERRLGYRMIAAVIPVEGQLHFIKATGPQKTIASHAAAILEIIRSARPKK
jgi:hypothetical protein